MKPDPFNIPAIVGEQVAGEAAKARQELENVIQFANKSQFDIAELGWKVKKHGYYEGYVTYKAYIEDLGDKLKFKPQRLGYLTKMAEVMDKVNIPREQYEPLGVAKLRLITRLNPDDTWTNPQTGDQVPMSEFITGFVEKGKDLSYEDIQQHVRTLQGLVGDDAMGWVHLYMKQSAIDQVVKPALEKAKAQIGSVGKDDEGNSLDASDGRAAEIIFVAFQTDPANDFLAGEG